MQDDQRKENQKFMSLYMGVILSIFLAYLFACVLSASKEHSISFIDAFSDIVQFKFLYVRLIPFFNSGAFIGGIAGVVLGIGITFFMMVDYERNYAYKSDEVAGTGGFMSAKELKEYTQKYIEPEIRKAEEKKAEMLKKDKNYKDCSYPYMIQSSRLYRPINSRLIIGNNNIAVIGGAGTGKSRFLIKPNILQMNASFVITDPSGEMLFSTGTALQENGYKIKIFNISDMTHSNCYNPLNYVRDEAGVSMLVDCFIKNTTGKDEKGEKFWTDAERLLYSACIFYLKDFCQEDSKKNFAFVLDMVNSSCVDENNPNVQSPLDKLFQKLPNNSLARKYYRAFKQAAGKTLKSIIISCLTRLQPFMVPQVINLTSTDEIELDMIGKEKTALFIITPQADRTYAFLASMLYSQLFETLYHIGEQQLAEGKSEQMDIPVRCLMDEFANIGEVPLFPSKLSTMRKYNISATVVLQDIAQIESMYKDDWKTLMGNCSSIVFLGSQEYNTCKYFSDMLGKKTIISKSRNMNQGKNNSSGKGFQSTGREVMTPDELSRMKPDETVVFTQNQRPVFDKKYDYIKHPNYQLTADFDHTRGFQYNKMSAYDNTNPKVHSMIKAQQAHADYFSKQKISDIGNAENVNITGNIDDGVNMFISEQKEKNRIYRASIEKVMEKAYENYEDPVCIFKVESLPSSILPKMTMEVSNGIGKKPMVIFSEYEKDDFINGVAYGDDDFIQSLERNYAKVTVHNGFAMINIRKDNFSKLKSELNSEYAA